MRDIISVIEIEIPAVKQAGLEASFEALGVDSFGMIELRAALENAARCQIDDRVWVEMRSPADLVSHLSTAQAKNPSASAFQRSRTHSIGMPQMAVSGLSESWLFKELGDFHWSMISEGLDMPSSRMVDGLGDRLYATFTRIRVESSSLSSFTENARLTLEARMTRYGGGMFFSEISGVSGAQSISARLMTSFSKRGNKHSNRGLVKGQPTIRPECPIPALDEKPAFAAEYSAARREVGRENVLGSYNYAINPYHDINGVGLVYFAAYPTIADTCELSVQGEGNKWAARSSTIVRDIMYFSNADANDNVLYKLLDPHSDESNFKSRVLLVNSSTEEPMALVATSKQLVR